MYYEYNKQQKIDWKKFFCLKNWLICPYLSLNIQVTSAMESAHTNRKKSKFSRCQENEVSWLILCVKLHLFFNKQYSG